MNKICPSEFLTKRFKVFERDNFQCVYCGRTVLKDKIVLHCDHIIPQSKGGSDDYGNLVTACGECNIGKKDIMLEKHQLDLIKNTLIKEKKDEFPPKKCPWCNKDFLGRKNKLYCSNYCRFKSWDKIHPRQKSASI